MSLLHRLQTKFTSVKQDLNQKFISSVKPETIQFDPVVVNAFQGASQLLENYQKAWSLIHTENLEICSNAEKVDQHLLAVHDRVCKAHSQMQQLCHHMNALTEVDTVVSQMSARLKSLQDLCVDTERELIYLQDRLEEEELLTNQGKRLAELLIYKCDRAQATEKERMKLAKEQASRLARRQEQLQHTLLERQAIFQEEFEKDLENFKEQRKRSTVEEEEEVATTLARSSVSSIVSAKEAEVAEEMAVTTLVPDHDPILLAQLEDFLDDVDQQDLAVEVEAADSSPSSQTNNEEHNIDTEPLDDIDAIALEGRHALDSAE